MVTGRRLAGSPARCMLGLAAAVLLAACVAADPGTGGGAAGPSAPGPASSASRVSPVPDLAAAASSTKNAAKVRAAIDAADLSEPQTIDAVDAVRFLDGAEVAAAAALAARVGGDALWAATWVYATAGTDPKPLRPLLANDDPSVRALAAAAVLSWGDRAGARPLAGLLLEGDALSGAYPPESIADYAAGSLERYVVGPTIAADATREDVASAWQAWLDAHGATMRFSTTTGMWTAP